MVYLTRRTSFSASHRLWSEHLSNEENLTIYEKCANPNGHGHNYVLEVTLRGVPDPQTGMVLNLTELKDIMNKQVVDWVDHKHLNYDVPWLEGCIPTTEVLAAELWGPLATRFPKALPFAAKSFATEARTAGRPRQPCE